MILLWLVLFLMLLALGGILGYFIHMLFFEKDNPDKAYIFVCNGNTIAKPYKANIVDSDKDGKSFLYNGNHVTFLPTAYKKEIYFKHRRMIFISKSGQIISSPFDEEVTLAPSEREDIIFNISTGHIGADMLRAMNGKAVIPAWLIIIVVGAIILMLGGGAWFLFNQQSKPPVNSPPPVTTNVTPTITLPQSGEVK